jgi:DNA-binding transcriptional MocR family regulator
MYWITSPCRNPDGASASDALLDDFDKIGSTSLVVVNETYRWFRESRSKHANISYVGSLSKIAGAGCRIGWIRGRRVVEILEQFPGELVARPATIWQHLWARFIIRDGLHLLREPFVHAPAASANRFVEVLSGRSHTEETKSPHMLLSWEQRDLCADDAVATLRESGLLVGNGRDFDGPPGSIRLSFTSVDLEAAEDAAKTVLRTLGMSTYPIYVGDPICASSS